MPRKLSVGQRAPDFSLPDEDGSTVVLTELLEDGPVMVVFYPGDFTPVCTRQLCSYRDAWSDFRELGLQIVGISSDSVEQHADFRSKHRFPFPLLADPGREVIKQWSGAGLLSGGRANRANYIIGRDGVVLYEHVEMVGITHRKPDELLESARTLQRQGRL